MTKLLEIIVFCSAIFWLVRITTAKFKVDIKFKSEQPLQYRARARVEDPDVKKDTDGYINLQRVKKLYTTKKRQKRSTGFQYNRQSDEEMENFIRKPTPTTRIRSSIRTPRYDTSKSSKTLSLCSN